MSTDRDIMPKSVADALVRSAEPMAVDDRAELRKRVIAAARRDSRAHYFASISHRFVAMLMAFAVLGSGVAYAANGALPGDPLYALKRGVEDALIALLPPGALEQRLLLGFAERRAGEAADLSTSGAGYELVDSAIQQLRAAVQAAVASGETLTEQEAQQIQQQAQDAPQQTREAISDAVTEPGTPQDTGQTSPGPGSDGKTSDPAPGNSDPGNPDAPGNSGESTGGAGSR